MTGAPPAVQIRTRRPRARHHRVDIGRPYPLGATPTTGGVNFAVYATIADKVEVCLYAEDGTTQVERISLPAYTQGVWHGFVSGLRAGQLYGLRVHGPYDPARGLRCNPNKLLIDPYARALDRPVRGDATQFAYAVGSEKEDFDVDAKDNGRTAVKGKVVRLQFDWGEDHRPRIAPQDTVFYELHVKGFTQTLPGVPEAQRGTYAGLASEAAIAHFKALGVTSLELLPVQAFVDDQRLVEAGLANYWGYNTIAFHAPEPRYGMGKPVDEFKGMVKALHAAGLEVILDVVYNHTAEGNHLGPTLSLKGIDNTAYYRLSPEDPRYYVDYTGTGNSMDTSSPAALRLVMDSLRYWVTEMHVDGFRFDLATTLGRDPTGQYAHRAAFFLAVAQDPVLARVKLIAEPWDMGPDGYQVGGFPSGWMEWNGRYRDAVRDYWRNADASLPEFAARLCGSADMLMPQRRPPWTSVNIVTVHDGFTLHDLVAYNEKHNDANGEGNRDGESHNRSWNCGAEGPSDDAAILDLRARQMRNFLTTLFVSHGVPLLLAGDESARSQQGNNNVYCQDSALSWLQWDHDEAQKAQLAFTQALTRLRSELPVLRLPAWPVGTDTEAAAPAIAWHSVWGIPMTAEEWDDPQVRCVAALLDSPYGDDSVMLLFNSTPEEVLFTLAQVETERTWTVRVDTRSAQVPPPDAPALQGGAQWALAAHSMAVLTAPSTLRTAQGINAPG